jgi:hypothetical protein
MALATALTREKSSVDAYRIASTGLTRYARYDALITPPSHTQRGVEGKLAPRVQYRTATLAHDDDRAPSWATRADGAGDCPCDCSLLAPSRGGLAIRGAHAEGEAYLLAG